MALRKLLTNHWIAWTGVPKEIILDPAQTNLGENLVGPCELEGSQIRPIVAGAQWQLGKTESHGGWFAHVLDEIIEEHQPENQEERLLCSACTCEESNDSSSLFFSTSVRFWPWCAHS